jgi:UDP-glucose 4-epimerase
VITLAEAGARVVIVDDLSNSFTEVLNRMHKILGEKSSQIKFVQVLVGACCPSLGGRLLQQ